MSLSLLHSPRLLLWLLSSTALAFPHFPPLVGKSHHVPLSSINSISDHPAISNNHTGISSSGLPSMDRRCLLFGFGLTSSLAFGGREASAALQFGRREKSSSLLYVNAKQNASDSLQREQIDLDQYTLNSELCLLKLLPVKNPIFRGLERSITGLSSLKSATGRC